MSLKFTYYWFSITLEDPIWGFELYMYAQHDLVRIYLVCALRWQLPLRTMYGHPLPFLSCWFTVICGHWPGAGDITLASLRTRQLIYQSFSLGPVEIRQRRGENIVYDSWAAAAETVNLFGCAGQPSDNGWRGLVEPAVPLGFVNAVRGGWRGSSAFISTFRDAHSCWPLDSAYLSLLHLLNLYCLAFHSWRPLMFSSMHLFLIAFLLYSVFPLHSHHSWEVLRRSI